MLGSILSVIRDSSNRKALSWLLRILIPVAAGAWVVVMYFFPSDGAKEPASPSIQAESGSIASGRDTKIGGDVNFGGEKTERE